VQEIEYIQKGFATLKLIKSFIREEKLSVKEANSKLKNLIKSNEIEKVVSKSITRARNQIPQ
jgi:hypothetical protein